MCAAIKPNIADGLLNSAEKTGKTVNYRLRRRRRKATAALWFLRRAVSYNNNNMHTSSPRISLFYVCSVPLLRVGKRFDSWRRRQRLSLQISPNAAVPKPSLELFRAPCQNRVTVHFLRTFYFRIGTDWHCLVYRREGAACVDPMIERPNYWTGGANTWRERRCIF